jgi:hypothetical protein
MEVTCFSETFVDFKWTTWRLLAEDSFLSSYLIFFLSELNTSLFVTLFPDSLNAESVFLLQQGGQAGRLPFPNLWKK